MGNNTLSTGSVLQSGKYWIVKVLGQGGFGITYLAEQVALGRHVAVKEFFMKELCNRDEDTLHVSVPSDGSRELVEKFRHKFVREARMIAGLNHEHIVKIHDVFEENGTAYYVMEYLPKGSLSNLVQTDGKLPESVAISYIREIASALEYLHHRSILHLDIKPANIMLDEDGRPVLIDFGISKHYDGTGSQTSSTPVGISNGYAPLEQYNQSDIRTFSPATDIYSLGATLYYLLRGQTPPSAHDVFESGLPPIPGISKTVSEVIDKSMSPRKNNRQQSAREFLESLPSIIVRPQYETLMFDVGYDCISVAVLTADGYSILCSKKLNNELAGFYELVGNSSGNFLLALVDVIVSLKRNCEKITSSTFNSCTAICPSDFMLPHIFILKEAFSRVGLQCMRVIDRCTSAAIARSARMQEGTNYGEFRFLTVDTSSVGRVVVKGYEYSDGILEPLFGESVFLGHIDDSNLLSNEIYYHKVIREQHRVNETICIGMKHSVSEIPEFGAVKLFGREDCFQGLYFIVNVIITRKLKEFVLLESIPDEILISGDNSSLIAMGPDTIIPSKKNKFDELQNMSSIVQRRKIFDASHNVSFKSFVLARIPQGPASDLSIDVDANKVIILTNRKSVTNYCVGYRSFIEANVMNEEDSDENTVIQ